MIVLNWNIRGLGDLDKRANVRDFIYLFGFDVVALQETKLCCPSYHLLRIIGGTQVNDWMILSSIGASGGQLIWWNDKLFEKYSQMSTRFSLSVKLKERLHNAYFVSPRYSGQMIEHSSLPFFKTSTTFMIGVHRSLGSWCGISIWLRFWMNDKVVKATSMI